MDGLNENVKGEMHLLFAMYRGAWKLTTVGGLFSTCRVKNSRVISMVRARSVNFSLSSSSPNGESNVINRYGNEDFSFPN
jgi:hypothetical protein